MFSSNILMSFDWDIVRQENKVHNFFKLVTTRYTQRAHETCCWKCISSVRVQMNINIQKQVSNI